jgi:hypothetical protein
MVKVHGRSMSRSALAAVASLIAVVATGSALSGCDRTVSKTKTEKTKTVDTPEGEKKVTETHEKTVETEKKK